jgi:hypothetical protein
VQKKRLNYFAEFAGLLNRHTQHFPRKPIESVSHSTDMYCWYEQAGASHRAGHSCGFSGTAGCCTSCLHPAFDSFQHSGFEDAHAPGRLQVLIHLLKRTGIIGLKWRQAGSLRRAWSSLSYSRHANFLGTPCYTCLPRSILDHWLRLGTLPILQAGYTK